MRIGILSAELDEESLYENKRFVREIRLKGHRAQIINYQKTVLITARGRGLLYQPNKNGLLQPVNVDAVIPRINEADDQSINLGTLALEGLMASGVYSTATPSAIRLSKNKIASSMYLAKQVPVPRTAAITGTEPYEVDIDKVLKAVEPNPNKRLVIKTIIGTHGKGVMPANSRGEARAILDGFLANGIPVLFQQFVEPIKKGRYFDLRLNVVGGKVTDAMQRVATKKDEIRANLALGGQGIPHTPTEQETELALLATKALGLMVAGVDIIPSKHGPMVIELNSSLGIVSEEVTGFNIVKEIVQLAINGARRGEKTAPQKIVETLNRPIVLRPITVLPDTAPLKKKLRVLSKLAD